MPTSCQNLTLPLQTSPQQLHLLTFHRGTVCCKPKAVSSNARKNPDTHTWSNVSSTSPPSPRANPPHLVKVSVAGGVCALEHDAAHTVDHTINSPVC